MYTLPAVLQPRTSSISTCSCHKPLLEEGNCRFQVHIIRITHEVIKPMLSTISQRYKISQSSLNPMKPLS
eukprot:m.191935 g.191935  ORF g.191935 m.191935 type:complete len:70 (-) comp16961_c1_seq4:1569-1778(-)